MNTTSPTKFNDTARLISWYIMMLNTDYCFRFHYHMFGSDIHQLKIYARMVPSNVTYLLWQRQGNQVSRFFSIFLPENLYFIVG